MPDPVEFDGELVEVDCAACGNVTTYSPAEPEERRVCAYCTGMVPDSCVGDEDADG